MWGWVLVDPIRLRLSRARGFDLQAHSQATNGLPAVNCARPGPLGNPFVVGDDRVPDAATAVRLHEGWMALMPGAQPGQRLYLLRLQLPRMRGQNLACWCRLDAPCHADTLLRLANAQLVCTGVDHG